MRIIRTLFFLCLTVNSFYAQVVKYSNEFLAIGVGARAMGMSGAAISSTRDVNAAYWNPAGILGIRSNVQLGLMHAEYFAGIAKYDYGALGIKIDSNSAAALSIIRFGVDNIPNTIQLIDPNGNVDYDKISKFSATDFAALISYARKIRKVPGLDIGANVKIIRRKIGDFAGAWGFGADFAANYSFKDWNIAAVGRDITGTFNAWSYNLSDDMKATFAATGNDIPENSVEVTVPRLAIGASRKFLFWKNRISVLPELNLVNTFDGKRNVLIKSKAISIDPSFGIELGYSGFVFLRGGIGSIQKTTDVKGKSITIFQPNVGVGIQYKIFAIDYAFTDIGDQSVALYSHVFSLRIDINKLIKNNSTTTTTPVNSSVNP
jgi:hypothetical protein